MIRTRSSVLASLALVVCSGCSDGEDSESVANPVSGGSGPGSLDVGGAGGLSGSGLAGTTGTVTGTSGTSASGMSASGMSASGMSASGMGATGMGASGMGTSGSGTGGDSSSDAGGMTGGTGGTPPVPGDCVGDWEAGTYPADFITGGGASSLPAIGGYNYAVHVPKGYDCHLPTPILFGLHGLGMSGYSFCVGGTSTPDRPGGLVAKADEAGFILVMPTGLAPTGGEGAIQAVRDMFKAIETHLNIDHGRVYATGHSFGGSMSFLLACGAADLFTATAPNAWTSVGACTPAKPIAVLASRGTEDLIAPPGDLAAAMRTLAMANGCSAMTTPATVPASGGDTTCVTHPDCDGGVEITHCTIMGGGHTWFGDPTCGTGADACAIVGANSEYYVNTDFAWDFLKRFSR
jgi:poly(3-hydroxybutyrate) depolymerase